jgi:hypothetical protein
MQEKPKRRKIDIKTYNRLYYMEHRHRIGQRHRKNRQLVRALTEKKTKKEKPPKVKKEKKVKIVVPDMVEIQGFTIFFD